MDFDKLIESMCYTSRHDFGLLTLEEQEPIRRQMRQLVENDVKHFFDQQKCLTCNHYRNDTKVFGDKRFVCHAIDDNYTQHFGGYFMPPESYSCSEWKEKINK